jgi:glycine/D-amino acid oxidase-like deaminating enzyme
MSATTSFWQRRWRGRPRVYDAVIVGGGIVGCATAYWLRRQQPDWRIAILDARTLGHGASGRNAGMLLQGTARDFVSDIERYGAETARRLWRFTRANRDLIEAELPTQQIGWRAEGSLTVAGDGEEAERLQASVMELRAVGASAAFLRARATNERLQAEGFHGSLYVTSGATVDPLRLVRETARASRADVYEQQPVEEIDWSDEAARLHTPDRCLTGSRVVLAVNAYLPRLLPALSRYVRPVRAQMLATGPAARQVIRQPAYTHQGHYYVRQTASGHVLAGGARHRHRATEVGYDDQTTPAVQSDIERYLHDYFPWTQPLAVEQRWSGTMGFSPDGRPVVGRVPGHEQSVWAAGFTGHGMSYGFRMGRLLAAQVRGRTSEDLDLFTARRFDGEAARRPAPMPSSASPQR